ncbi:NHL repeat-containing protein [Aeoliella mucimassa]|uniref:NHL repeat protein n=1 Tax=Aeoliella mucimassa TaxID=2527972 RepID=A0A518AW38_9BACT|nr:hypothetical protein [Aeoliella mucimassa]QDU58928.1 hypothetical protein Pan181_51690 [Aeoliella mucimassa]
MKFTHAAAALLLFVPGYAVAHEGVHTHPVAAAAAADYAEALAEGRPVITGAGEHRYQLDYDWLRNVEESFHGPTHGSVVVDAENRVYVSTDAEQGIFVLDADGQRITTLGPATQYLHSMVMTKEGDKQVIVAASPGQKKVLKIALDGTVLLSIPNEKTGEVDGGFDGVTSVCLLPNGQIVASCGYGSNKVHFFDAEGKHLATFGGKGQDPGAFNCCHGLAYDDRFDEPRLLIANREASQLEHYTLEGEFVSVYSTDVSRPCLPVLKGDCCYVAELNGRVTVLDREGKLLARLGENTNKSEQANFGVDKAAWQPGVFTAPHGLGFDADGGLYVQDWNKAGRVTRLLPIASE